MPHPVQVPLSGGRVAKNTAEATVLTAAAQAMPHPVQAPLSGG